MSNNHAARSADVPTSGTSLSSDEIRAAKEALSAARGRNVAVMGENLKPVTELVVISSRAQEAFQAIEQCPRCHNEQPPVGGPYCDCEIGQSWLAQHRRWADAERQRGESRQRRLEQRFGRMEVPPRYMSLSPETLTAEELVGKSEAIRMAEAWARGETEKPGLVVWGLPGVGKSALGWWAVPRKGWGLWLTWPGFYKAVQDGYSNGDAEAKMRAAQSVPVLFLDDVGDPDRVWYDKEGRLQGRMETDDRRDILFRVVNHRVQKWLPLFVTSNLNGAELLVQFGDRIVSRLLELCEFVEMGGVDLRRAYLRREP